jgi:hypothetical protein
MCIRRETQEKARRSLAFSPVSKPHAHITCMLRQCTSIKVSDITSWYTNGQLWYLCYSIFNFTKGTACFSTTYRGRVFSIPVSKPHAHITCMLRQCTSIAYIYYSQNEATRAFNIKSSNIYFLKRFHKIYVCCVTIYEVLSCFPLILCMYLKTISTDRTRFRFVCSIYNWPISSNNIGQAILVGKFCHCRIKHV